LAEEIGGRRHLEDACVALDDVAELCGGDEPSGFYAVRGHLPVLAGRATARVPRQPLSARRRRRCSTATAAAPLRCTRESTCCKA
jgi:hypothetical protein